MQRGNALESQVNGFWNMQKNMITYLHPRKNQGRARSNCKR